MITRYIDSTNNLEARVAQRLDGRYAVTLRDLDADEVLPIAQIYADFATADRVARRIAEGVSA